jgi:hypothetical protein
MSAQEAPVAVRFLPPALFHRPRTRLTAAERNEEECSRELRLALYTARVSTLSRRVRSKPSSSTFDDRIALADPAASIFGETAQPTG